MRVICSFQVKKLPLHYRMAIVSIMKESIRASSEEYYEKLYMNQKTKPFVFSPFLKNFCLKGDEIELDELRVVISSPDYEFLLHLYNGLQSKKRFEYKGYEFIRRKIVMGNEKKITSSVVIFRTLSPLLIEDEKKIPIAPDDPNYEKHINYLADTILYEYRGRGLYKPLTVRPIRFKKMVIKESNHQFTEKYGEQHHLYFTAYHGLFHMSGEPADLQLLYQLGLSKRRNQGFGMLEVEEVKE
ncbi:CRISPR-associated endoribonuclease Cas6 [Anoxybacillus salavatliensis]|uniref:CRISPR-associated endoribonuclease Cas6 n=1 Tax=Anoxybacillus TaxID=150247 RepID=UPI0013D3BCC5|nr:MULTISPECIES: CRISPR-associated endoribonuclease Cas6 [Anoxybacillus]MCQ5364629.1 CRISPR-associated endoribonuclease Cas6 [Anoxybacillus gonensis]